MDSKQDNGARKSRLAYVGVVFIIASLLILASVYQPGVSNSDQTYVVVFRFGGEDPRWHSGQLVLTYEDGHIEISDLFQTIEEFENNGEYRGLFTYVPVVRNFTNPERLEIEYLCSGLNMTVGPFSFMSNNPQVLYSDAHGRTIEIWTGH